MTTSDTAAVWRALDRMTPDRVTITAEPADGGTPLYCAAIWSVATDGYVCGYGPGITDAVRQALRNAGIAGDDVPPPAPGAMYPVHREPIRRDDADHADAPGDPDAPQPDWHDVANWTESAASHLRRAAILLDQLHGRGYPYVEYADELLTSRDLREMQKALLVEHGYARGRCDAGEGTV